MRPQLRTLGLVVARAGSKRLPGKNVKPFAGAPLIAWTCRTARAAASLDRVILSTDDSSAAKVALAEGIEVPFVRPSALGSDDSSSVDVALHALNALAASYDVLVLLQPTSPLRKPSDVDACVAAVIDGAPAALTVAPIGRPLAWLKRLDVDGTLSSIETADGSGEVCWPTGAVYAVRVDLLREELTFSPPGTVGIVTPIERAHDIDTAHDFRIAEAVFLLSGDARPL